MTSEETITISKEVYQQFLDKKSEIEWLKHQLAELQRLIYWIKTGALYSTGSSAEYAV
jgi:hypothetical protein